MTITLKDRLSHLTYREACKLLGAEGERLIRQGGKYDFDISDQVTWGDDLFRLNLGEAMVTLSLKPEKPKSLDFSCSQCPGACEHLGAAFSLILEEKLSLRLSAPPPEKQPTPPVYSRRANLVSKKGDSEFGPGQAYLAQK